MEKTNGMTRGKVVELGARARELADTLYATVVAKETGEGSLTVQTEQSWKGALLALQQAEANLLWLVEHA